tara:strand:+ start:3588 stop:4313 length:726 start_codon:yes stop_codon:yes gene_type:complete
MNDLVIMRNEVPVISTFDIFERMGYKEHRKLKLVINANIDAFNNLGFLPLERTKPSDKKGGRPIESYLLNEDHFILLVLLAKNSPESIELKIRVSDEFRRMKRVIANLASQRESPDRQKVRSDGKAVYLQKTDVIKQFVDYAKSQGSTSAERYYSNLAAMENKALFFIERKYKNMREIMTIKQLMQVATADQVVEKALNDGMTDKLHYKDIYKLAKSRVISFAEIIGKSQLHDLALENKND